MILESELLHGRFSRYDTLSESGKFVDSGKTRPAMGQKEGSLTEAAILERLEGELSLPPLRARLKTRSDSPSDPDAIIEIVWSGRVFEFNAEVKARSTPRMIVAAMDQARGYSAESGRYPMVVMPYLRPEQLEQLERAGISGIDLCGNGVVTIPGQLLVFRTGQPNRYPDSLPTKYAYRGTTSLVPRVFLCRREFASLRQIEEEISARKGTVTLATISKALKRMQEDVLIDRNPDCIRLLQPDALLDKLAGSYQPPKQLRRVLVKLQEPVETGLRSLPAGEGYILSGATSVKRYAVAGRSDRAIIYCRNTDKALSAFGDAAAQTERFANAELWETRDPTVFFDQRLDDGIAFASPVQTYLELMVSDKRDREIAEQVRQRILADLNNPATGRSG